MSTAPPRPARARLLLADDHVLVRIGLRQILEAAGFIIVAEAGDGMEAVRLAAQFRPDIALLDVSMPGLNGLESTREILRTSERTRVILLTMHNEDQYVLEAVKAGVSGYVLKTKAPGSVIEAVEEVLQGNTFFSPGISRILVKELIARSEAEIDVLTSRERQILQLIGESKTTKEIAVLLGISVKTAESHRNNILQKLDLHDTAGLVRYAIRRGLIQP
jgi:DNA-binding NarL/FixJ family response regulator